MNASRCSRVSHRAECEKSVLGLPRFAVGVAPVAFGFSGRLILNDA